MPRLLKTESSRHQQAFERYFAMGRDRSYARLATELSVDEDTIKLWGRSFHWQERLEAREQEITRKVQEQTTHTVVIDRVKRRKAAEMGFVQWVNDLKSGKLKPKFSDIKDLFQMMEAEDRGHEKGSLSPTAPPKEVAEYINNLSTYEFNEVNRILAEMGKSSDPVFVLPDNGSAPTDRNDDE